MFFNYYDFKKTFFICLRILFFKIYSLRTTSLKNLSNKFLRSWSLHIFLCIYRIMKRDFGHKSHDNG